MKTIVLLLSLLTSGTPIAWAQLHDDHPISHDPMFNEVLKRRLVYPYKAGQSGIYERVYVGFHVTEKGHIDNVSLLSPPEINHHFDHTIKSAMRRMPPLNPRYTGRYVMPVVFALIASPDTLVPPVYALPPGSLENRTMLNPIYVVGDSRSFMGGDRWSNRHTPRQ